MEKDRLEFRSEIEIADSEWLNAIELNFGYSDYKHSESGFEDEGASTFVFKSTFTVLIV